MFITSRSGIGSRNEGMKYLLDVTRTSDDGALVGGMYLEAVGEVSTVFTLLCK